MKTDAAMETIAFGYELDEEHTMLRDAVRHANCGWF
jgi:hypothetical protein